MAQPSTTWIMIQIDIRRRENNDSRYYSEDCFEDVEIIQEDSREELLAKCYGIRKKYKNPADISPYDSGDIVRFVGPFEVMNNDAWTDSSGQVFSLLETWQLLDELKVKMAVDEGATLYELTK